MCLLSLQKILKERSFLRLSCLPCASSSGPSHGRCLVSSDWWVDWIQTWGIPSAKAMNRTNPRQFMDPWQNTRCMKSSAAEESYDYKSVDVRGTFTPTWPHIGPSEYIFLLCFNWYLIGLWYRTLAVLLNGQSKWNPENPRTWAIWQKVREGIGPKDLKLS